VLVTLTQKERKQNPSEKFVSEGKAGDFGMISERIRKEYGSGLARAFEIIYYNPEFTAEQIAHKLGKTARTVENYIAKLKKAGFIERRGPKLGGHWEILK
jgi:predicted HTH transcriptional regulator